MVVPLAKQVNHCLETTILQLFHFAWIYIIPSQQVISSLKGELPVIYFSLSPQFLTNYLALSPSLINVYYLIMP